MSLKFNCQVCGKEISKGEYIFTANFNREIYEDGEMSQNEVEVLCLVCMKCKNIFGMENLIGGIVEAEVLNTKMYIDEDSMASWRGDPYGSPQNFECHICGRYMYGEGVQFTVNYMDEFVEENITNPYGVVELCAVCSDCVDKFKENIKIFIKLSMRWFRDDAEQKYSEVALMENVQNQEERKLIEEFWEKL